MLWIGVVTYGNARYTKLCLESLCKYTNYPFNLVVVIGKPEDEETWDVLEGLAEYKPNLHTIAHQANKGFPASINDIYDHVYAKDPEADILFVGNDTIAYPGAVDRIAQAAQDTDYDYISGKEIQSRAFLQKFPQFGRDFDGGYRLKNDRFIGHLRAVPYFPDEEPHIRPIGRVNGFHNFGLVKRSYFDKVGYVDVNFFPCLDPETRVLTEDLRWVPVKYINVGDRLVGVDEYPEAPRASRSYRRAVVEGRRILEADCVKITLSDGRKVICSKDHRWLVKRKVSEGYFWKEAGSLEEGQRMCAPLDVWSVEDNWRGGYMAGMFDGEGSLKARETDSGREFALAFYQKKGAVLDRVLSYLYDLDVHFVSYDRQSSTAQAVEIHRRADVFRLLGSFRPVRFVEDVDAWDGLRLRSRSRKAIRIEKIEDVGKREVIDLQVSTKAFLAEGMVTHNCYFEDNDYVKRGFLADCKFGEISNAPYFHFWSRTAYEALPHKVNERYFPLNRLYYNDKWGGDPGGNELHDFPFAGANYRLGSLPFEIRNSHFKRCEERQAEMGLIDYWRWTPRTFQNRHKGQRCIIAANGPSLNNIDMALLKDEIVIALNRGYLKEDLPITYLVCCNGTVLEQFGEEIVDVETEATFITPISDLWRPHVYGMRYTPDIGFYNDFDGPIYQGHTVTFVALQLAYYMGFSEVILVGLDHHFPRAEGKPTNKLVTSTTPDTDHFTPDYFGPGTKWEYPNLERSEEAYGLAREAFEADGRVIWNASTKTKLDIFPRLTLEELLL